MNNAEDILKKILLNMRYDPKKTLKENNTTLKRILNEGCIPLDTKLETYSDSEDGSRNKPRNITYPELGTWGDGNCKCKKNTECLEYNKTCCTDKKGVVSIGNKNDFSMDGSTLELPGDSKILGRIFLTEYSKMTPQRFSESYPLIVENCKSLYTPEDYESCLKKFKESYLFSVKNNGVHKFTANGKEYNACYQNKSMTKPYPLLKPEEMTWFTGYRNGCKVRGELWNGVTKKETVKSGVNSVGNKFAIENPGSIENNYDNTIKFSFDLEL